MNISNFHFEIIRFTFKMFTEILSILRLCNAPNIIRVQASSMRLKGKMPQNYLSYVLQNDYFQYFACNIYSYELQS